MATHSTSPDVRCPFCGASMTDRVEIDGQRFLVFRCMFTPEVDPSVPDSELSDYLSKTFGSDGKGYFRAACDRLHLYAVRGGHDAA
jgi:hypothetical protein